MIKSRIKSITIMSNDVYKKRIRRMYNEKLFDNERYRNITIQNTIYYLSKAKFDIKQSDNINYLNDEELKSFEEMIKILEQARTMGTTLWFDSVHQREEMRESIIATGQFTTCYNLLRYIQKIEKQMTLSIELKTLKIELLNNWIEFKKKPKHLLDVYKL